MTTVLPITPGGLGGLTWPLATPDDQPVTTIDRTSCEHVVAAVAPGVLLPSQQHLDYQLLGPQDLTKPFRTLPLLEQQLSFFARHLAHEGPVPSELLQELLVEQLERAAGPGRGNTLAALQVQLPVLPPSTRPSKQQQPATAATAAAQQQQQQQQRGHAGTAVLAVSTCGTVGQQLVLTMLQAGPIPVHLTAADADGMRTAAGSRGRQGAGAAGGSFGRVLAAAAAGAGGARAAAGPARAAAAKPEAVEVPVQLSVCSAAAVLDLGACIQQVGMQQLTAELLRAWRDTVAAAAAAPGSGGHAAALSNEQQARAVKLRQAQDAAMLPVALVWARSHHKVYAAVVLHHVQHQQQRTPGPSSSTSGGDDAWQLLPLGVAALPRPLLVAEVHPLLPQMLAADEEGGIHTVDVCAAHMQAAAHAWLQQQHLASRHAAQQQQGVGGASLHPDEQLTHLQLQRVGSLSWFREAQTAAPAPLLVALGAHPRQLLAACGGTLMRHSFDGSSEIVASLRGGAAAAAAAAKANPAAAGSRALPGKLLLQLPDGDAIQAIATWSGSQQEWMAAAASTSPAAAVLSAPASGGAAGVSPPAAGPVVHVRHLLAVATSSRLLLLDLRKAAQEPVLIWQYCISGITGAPTFQPSLLMLLPTPPAENTAASSCCEACFAARAAAAVTAVAAADGAGTRQGVAAPPPPGAAAASTPAGAASQPLQVDGSGGGRVRLLHPQGFDRALYPTQMFQGTEGQGFGRGPGTWATQASQIGDPATWGMRGLQQQQQQQQQQQTPGGSAAAAAAAGGGGAMLPPRAAPPAAPPSAAVRPAAAAEAAAKRAAAAGHGPGGAAASGDGSCALRGMIVFGCHRTGELHSVNFKLCWSSLLSVPLKPLDKMAAGMVASSEALVAKEQQRQRQQRRPPAPAVALSAAGSSRAAAEAAAAAAQATRSQEAAAAGGGDGLQTPQAPGIAALSFVTRAMKSLALSPAAAAASAATRAGAAAAAGGWGAGRGGSIRGRRGGAAAVTGSALRGWHLPVTVQATTPGAPRLLAEGVGMSVRRRELRVLQHQRAAAAAVQGDARSMAEAVLQPGAAMDAHKSVTAQQALEQMQALPDMQGFALVPIPWCWSGGSARALMLRCSAEGDVCLQLCSTPPARSALRNKQSLAAAAQKARASRVGLTSAAAGMAGSAADRAVLASLFGGAVGPTRRDAQQQQQQQQRQQEQAVTLRPVLALVDSSSSAATADAGAAAPGHTHKQQQQQQQQQRCSTHTGRSFEALQAWLDAEVEPPQLVTRAAEAQSRRSYRQQTAERLHSSKQTVQLTAHTQAVLALLRSSLGQQQQQQQDAGNEEEQQQQHPQQQLLLPVSDGRCGWPRQSPGSTGVAAASDGAGPSRAFTMLQYPVASISTDQQRPLDGSAASRVLAAVAHPVTLLELQHLLLLQHAQDHAAAAAPSLGSKKRTAATAGADAAATAAGQPAADTQQAGEQQQGAEAMNIDEQQQQGCGGRRTAPAARKGGRGNPRTSGREPGLRGALDRLASLRAEEPSEQEDTRAPAAAAAAAAAAAGGAASQPAAAAAAAEGGNAQAAQLIKLLQQQLKDPSQQLAARLLFSLERRQQQQQAAGGAATNSIVDASSLHKLVAQLKLLDGQQQLAVRPLSVPCRRPWQDQQQSSAAAAGLPSRDQQGLQHMSAGTLPATDDPTLGTLASQAAVVMQSAATQQQQHARSSNAAAAAAAATATATAHAQTCRLPELPVPAECVLHGLVVEQPAAAEQLLDVAPRLVTRQQQPQKQGRGAFAGSAAAAAAAAAGASEPEQERVPPGMLALAMSAEAQQRWLQLNDDWVRHGQEADEREQQQQQQAAAAAAAGAAGPSQGTQAGAERKQKKQKRATQQQQQQQQRAAGTASQQQQRPPGSALLAALGGQSSTQASQQQRLRQGPQATVTLGAQQAHGSQQQQTQTQPGSLLARLTGRQSQQQQQQQRPTPGPDPPGGPSGGSMLAPSSRRR